MAQFLSGLFPKNQEKNNREVSPEKRKHNVDSGFKSFAFPQLGRIHKKLKEQPCPPKYGKAQRKGFA